jgi:hypothetical protein
VSQRRFDSHWYPLTAPKWLPFIPPLTRACSKQCVAVERDPLPYKTLPVLGQPLRLAIESFLFTKRWPFAGEMLNFFEAHVFFPDSPNTQRFAFGELITRQCLGGELLVGGKFFDPMEHTHGLMSARVGVSATKPALPVTDQSPGKKNGKGYSVISMNTSARA